MYSVAVAASRYCGAMGLAHPWSRPPFPPPLQRITWVTVKNHVLLASPLPPIVRLTNMWISGDFWSPSFPHCIHFLVDRICFQIPGNPLSAEHVMERAVVYRLQVDGLGSWFQGYEHFFQRTRDSIFSTPHGSSQPSDYNSNSRGSDYLFLFVCFLRHQVHT